MEELLKKWAELAPDECSFLENGLYYQLKTFPNVLVTLIRDWHHPIILGATMQAIEARGWRWGRDPISGTYQIVIPKKGFATDYWEWIEGYENLLEAYLKALKEVS